MYTFCWLRLLSLSMYVHASNVPLIKEMHDMQEPNFHVLYLELMEQMNKPMMDRHLASTTFKYIKILLRSDRIKTQVSHLPTGCIRLHSYSFQALAAAV